MGNGVGVQGRRSGRMPLPWSRWEMMGWEQVGDQGGGKWVDSRLIQKAKRMRSNLDVREMG